MNKQHFYEMDVHLRARKINEMLKNSSLSEVAKKIGIPSSTFSKEMQKGDYIYIKRENKYFRFIRDDSIAPSGNFTTQSNEALEFLNEHLDDLKRLIKNYNSDTIQLNPKVYTDSSKVVTRSIRIRENLYKEFQSYCNSHYPYYSIHDLVAHCLVEFTNKKNNTK